MNLNRYEIFLKVAEIGNITKAAEAMHYTQAGVSHAIAALEKEAGAALFVRSSKGVSLTENGRRLLPPVQSLVNDQRALSQTIYEINGEVAGTLRVGTFTSVSAQWLPGIIREFQLQYPKMEFELLAGDYDEITERILSGKIDCGFLTSPADDGLLFTSLYRDPMLVLLPKDHPLAEQSSVSLEEIQNEPFILPMKGSDNDIIAALSGYADKINVRYTLNDDFSVMAMVANGFGITILPELILRNFSFDLAVRPLSTGQTRTIGIASLPLNRVSVLTRRFVEFLGSTYRLEGGSSRSRSHVPSLSDSSK